MKRRKEGGKGGVGGGRVPLKRPEGVTSKRVAL